jgi:hypothetical protein
MHTEKTTTTTNKNNNNNNSNNNNNNNNKQQQHRKRQPHRWCTHSHAHTISHRAKSNTAPPGWG